MKEDSQAYNNALGRALIGGARTRGLCETLRHGVPLCLGRFPNVRGRQLITDVTHHKTTAESGPWRLMA